MSDNELRNKILEVIIKAHTDVNTNKNSRGSQDLPTYEKIREYFEEVEKDHFYNQFSMVREEWLETILLSDKKKVYREIGGARFFLYGEGGYVGREERKKIAEDAAKATKSSSRAAWGSTVAAIALLAVSVQNCAKENELVPLLIDAQKLNRENKSEIVILRNRINELREKIEVLYRNDTTLVP